MKRSVLSVWIILLLVVPFHVAFTQPQFSMENLGVNGGLTIKVPIGSFGDVAGLGVGFVVQGEYVFTPQLHILAGFGYVKYGGKDVGYYSYSYSEIPLTGGVKFYLSPGNNLPMRLFILGEFGFHRMGYSWEWRYTDIYGNPRVERYSSGTIKLGVTPGAGVEFNVANFRVDVSGFLAFVTGSYSHIGIRSTVHFNLGKK